MSKSRLLCVNFGYGKKGLSTVGYRLYNKAGTALAASSTTGVAELGTNTGIYYVSVDLADDFDGMVLWTTGEASPRYGLEPTLSQLNSIQDETDHIRLIWNSLRNQGDIYGKLSRQLDKVKTLKPKEYDKEFSGLHTLLKRIDTKKLPEFPKLPDFPKIPAPVVNIPKTIIPDYTKQFHNMNILFNALLAEINKIPKQHKDYTSDLSNITGSLERVLNNLEAKLDTVSSSLDRKINVVAKSDELKSDVGNLHYEINKLKKVIDDTQSKLSKVDDNITNTMKPAKFLKDIYQVIKQSEDLKQMAGQYQKRMSNLKLAGF